MWETLNGLQKNASPEVIYHQLVFLTAPYEEGDVSFLQLGLPHSIEHFTEFCLG